jgi:hypothetical protein
VTENRTTRWLAFDGTGETEAADIGANIMGVFGKANDRNES